MTKRQYHHGNLHEALLEAADKELRQSGPEKLSLRKVARRAGVSSAASAHHFGDARGLITALTTLGFRRFAKALSRTNARVEITPEKKLIHIGTAYVEFALTNPEMFSLMFASSMPDFEDTNLDKASMLSFAHFLDAVRGNLSSKRQTGHDVDVGAMAAWSTVHGLAILLLTGRMRSVLKLENAKRKRAIRAILAAQQI